MLPSTLRQRLTERATDEGFDAIGVARAEVLGRDRLTLARWLEAGRHAGMTWMARAPEKRSDPSSLLPGCRSVVMLAMNYGVEEPLREAGRSGRVAKYARGRDYHNVLGRRLRRLVAWVEEQTGQAARSFVDTGPVLERAWAERAGLGWIGKNSNLLTREMGSWLLLGELLCVAEIAADPGPHADFCGSCTACIDACPTSAIVADGVVDATLCISYWTIEHRGTVPAERRSGNGDWIFGCDVCQDVCPWNRTFGRVATGDPFESRPDLAALDPEEILGLDEATFRTRYSGTALMRARWDGLRRNACIVLGNRGSATALPALARALEDGDPILRIHAAWAVTRIDDPAATALFERALAREPDAHVRAEILRDAARLPRDNDGGRPGDGGASTTG